MNFGWWQWWWLWVIAVLLIPNPLYHVYPRYIVIMVSGGVDGANCIDERKKAMEIKEEKKSC